MTTHTAYLIPCDPDIPIKRLDLSDDLRALQDAVFEGTGIEDKVIDVAGFRPQSVQLAFDDMGLYREGPCTNARAMALWAKLAGRRIEDFLQPLVGNFVVIGLDPNDGETIDVPEEVAAWMGL